jgi:hypothetical protein
MQCKVALLGRLGRGIERVVLPVAGGWCRVGFGEDPEAVVRMARLGGDRWAGRFDCTAVVAAAVAGGGCKGTGGLVAGLRMAASWDQSRVVELGLG